MTLLQGVNPRTGTPVGRGVPETTSTQLEHLLTRSASAAGPFAATAPRARARLLRALAARLETNTAGLVSLAIAETGLLEDRLTAELARTSDQLRLFATVVEEGAYLEVIIDHDDPAATPARPDLRRWLVPCGPVLIYAASNFPFAFSVLGGDTASSLACGAPTLVKAHPSHPGLSAAVAEVVTEVVAAERLPDGVFGAIFGDAPGIEALRDPRVKACGFTGSATGGRYLLEVASSRPEPIPFYGELGSINPVVVSPAAATNRGQHIADGFVASITIGSGQFCTKPGLFFLPAGHGLEASLSSAIAALPPTPLLNARIREQHERDLDQLTDHPATRLLATGATPPDHGSWATPRLYAVTAAELIDNPAALTDEHFGPVAIIVTYDDTAQLHAALATIHGSLTATVHAEPGERFPTHELVAVLSRLAGRVIWNSWPTGLAVSWATSHGGPWPATTNVGHTSVGATSIRRWLRPVCYQALPESELPEPLRDANPWRLPRRIDGTYRLP